MNGSVSVLFFTSSLGGGGAEMHLLRVINHLDRGQFQPSLALARRGGSYESSLAADIPVHYLSTGSIRSSTWSMLRAPGPLRRIIQREKPDILCSVLGHANVVALAASRGLSTATRKVLSIQNPVSIEYRYARNPVDRFLGVLTQHLYPRADRIIALSQGVARDLVALIPSVAGRTVVISNAGVDPRVEERALEPISPDEQPPHGPLIVACGRLTEQKGFPLLLDAFAAARSRVGGYLWIVGEGEQRSLLERKIDELALRDYVRLLGFKPNPYKYMAAADVFVLSSLWEGFGNVVVEAMACGTPVIATDCPSGPGEIITDGVNGILVPPGDSAALSRAMVRVLGDPDLRQKVSQNGKKRAQDFSAAKIARSYQAVFLELVGHHAANSRDGEATRGRVASAPGCSKTLS